jgi:hypothetical protein
MRLERQSGDRGVLIWMRQSGRLLRRGLLGRHFDRGDDVLPAARRIVSRAAIADVARRNEGASTTVSGF